MSTRAKDPAIEALERARDWALGEIQGLAFHQERIAELRAAIASHERDAAECRKQADAFSDAIARLA